MQKNQGKAIPVQKKGLKLQKLYMYFDEVEFLRLSGGLFFTSRSRGIFLGERKGEDRGMTSQSVTLAVRS